jgi:ElaB/YqjD/DUF883 family membrane-anchored ribosome-binding protein
MNNHAQQPWESGECRFIAHLGGEKDKAMLGQKQESENRSLGSGAQTNGGATNGTSLSLRQATEAIEKLRSRINEASQAMRDLTQVSEQWAEGTQGRVRDMAMQLRNQGERAVSTVSQQVEHNPLTSLAIAFAFGCVCAALIRR